MKLSSLVLATAGTAVGAATVTVVGALLLPVVEVSTSTGIKAAAVAAVGTAVAATGYLLCTERVIDACEETIRSLCND